MWGYSNYSIRPETLNVVYDKSYIDAMQKFKEILRKVYRWMK